MGLDWIGVLAHKKSPLQPFPSCQYGHDRGKDHPPREGGGLYFLHHCQYNRPLRIRGDGNGE